jgi:subtilisin family serine protease
MGEPRARLLSRIAGLGFAAAAAITVAIGAATPSAAAEGQVLYAGSADTIAGSYIVVFKDGLSAQNMASATTARYGGQATYTYQAALHGYNAKMTETQAKRVAADPSVAYVQQDRAVHLLDTQTNPPSYGLDRVDQRNLPLDNSYTFSNTASNVNAYVIDTGIRVTHQTFGGRATFLTNTTGDGNNTDCNGHGTHVSGTIGGSQYGLAKGVHLFAVKVLDCNGSGSFAGVAQGIDFVAQHHQAGQPAVANMSLGAQGSDAATETAVRNATADGVVFAIASGNSNADACGFTPARVAEAITVNASDINDARASFSNFGTCTDIFAPGVNITSAWMTSDTATNTISGTSMATPHVAGGAALFLGANPTATPAQVQAALKSNGTPNKISNPGTGSPNTLLFTGTGGTPPPPGPCPAATNGTDVAIPDLGTGSSPITISGCTGNASSASTVEVHIKHTFIGDLVVDLIAPDGAVFNLLNRQGGATHDINQTFTVNLSNKPTNGTWTLRASDRAAVDSGTIDSWTLDL